MTTRLQPTFDSHLYTQIGLDSGSLTMLGSVVHQLGKPGEYRGAVHRGPDVVAVFSVTSDSNSPTAQVTVDLSGLEQAQSGTSNPATARAAAGVPDSPFGCGGNAKGGTVENRYTVNPRGYVLFHVRSGAGGYYVHLRGVDAAESDKGYDTRTLSGGDIFTAMILRPGTYSIVNPVNKAHVEAVVQYPKIGDKPYEPPTPVRVVCNANGFQHEGKLSLGVGQGLIFEARAATRIQIQLVKPDDGPRGADRGRTGLRKAESIK